MDREIHAVNKGKVVYFIAGQRFENTSRVETYVDEKDKKHVKTITEKDGREKAEKYCLDNFLNPNDIAKFDSRTECDRYEYLLEQQKNGLISNLGHHYTLQIIPEFTNANGDVIPALTYEADFIYKDEITGQRVVEDVKGSEYFLDDAFIVKKKAFDYLMLEGKKLYIRVILYRDKEWVEWHIGDKKKSSKMLKKQREEIKKLKAEKHANEIAENLKKREIKRLQELRELSKTTKLIKKQRERLAELESKYGV